MNELKQEKYVLTINSENVLSTDKRFSMDNLEAGDNYKPLDVYMEKANGEIVRRYYTKGERRLSNQTMARIAFQAFEREVASLPIEQKETFPICKYDPGSETICGIFSSVDEFRQHRNSIEYMTYSYGDGRQFVIYCWNIFSTILFVQEYLKRFGGLGDKFVLTYRDKSKEESEPEIEPVGNSYRLELSRILLCSKNIILRGAPGTGKSYLAKQIAADIVSGGTAGSYAELTTEQKQQIEFVQFHPSYDYSDFVEGLRPKINSDGSMGFELQDGIFKRFAERAKKNLDDVSKTQVERDKELSVQEMITEYFSDIDFGEDRLFTITHNEFFITGVDDKHIDINIPNNPVVKKLTLSLSEIKQMLASDVKFTKVKDVTAFFGKSNATQGYSYDLAVYNDIKKKVTAVKVQAKQEELKNYVFIIDEINRGEISKIFGELFFSIDPGYRGIEGAVSTQYANMHETDEKFYIPENIYIIGTMNDIDRSVDSFDFAMRRRFRFIELKANEQTKMLDILDEDIRNEAISRMTALNNAIAQTPDLNENYQLGAAYFLKLSELTFDELWTDHLEPLLHEYVQGMYDEKEIMKRFFKAYNNGSAPAGDEDENTQGS